MPSRPALYLAPEAFEAAGAYPPLCGSAVMMLPVALRPWPSVIWYGNWHRLLSPTTLGVLFREGRAAPVPRLGRRGAPRPREIAPGGAPAPVASAFGRHRGGDG